MTQTTTWRADPLAWGHGPRLFEMFLEPTCPFSVRAFGKLDALLEAAGEARITVRLTMQSQPWHMYSGVVTRCVIAASTLPGGRESARAVLAAGWGASGGVRVCASLCRPEHGCHAEPDHRPAGRV